MWNIIKQIARNRIRTEPIPTRNDALGAETERIQREVLEIPGHALAIRQVDAGSCNGGLFGESYASCGRVSNVIPVDLVVPGCPPAPVEILRGILTAVHRCASAPGETQKVE